MRALEVIVFGSILGVGCKSTSSAELATNEIRANLDVAIEDNDPRALDGGTADAGDSGSSGSYVSASLYKNDGILDVVDLADGDDLSVTTNLSPSTRLTRGLPGFYELETPIDYTKLTDATFVLSRKNGASAPSSKIVVPPAMTVTAPLQDATVSAAAGKVTFTWSNPVAGAQVFAWMKPCGSIEISATSNDAQVADTGSFAIAWATMPGGAPTSASCYEARILRTLKGTIDPAWRSGSTAIARRTHYLTFTATP
ncbi:MAG: hypothetical protein ACXWP4_13945 [Polyangiales bacterium]